MNRLTQAVCLVSIALLLASCGGGGGGFSGRPEIRVQISADKTTLAVNTLGSLPNPAGPFTNTMTVQVTQDGRPFPASNVSVDLLGPNGSGALFYLDGDPAHEECETVNGVEICVPLAFRRLVFDNTTGFVTFHFSAFSSPGTVTVVATAQDPATGRSAQAELQLVIGSGANTGLPASVRQVGETPDMYIQGLGRADTGTFQIQLVDDGGFPIASNGGVNNLRVELLPNRPNGGERLSANSVSGPQTGNVINTFTINGLGQFSLRSGNLPGTVSVRVTADRADNNVDNGIQDPVSAVLQALIGSGQVKSLTFTGPFAGAVSNNANFLALGPTEFIGDGVYVRQLSIIGTDEFGNPPIPGVAVSLRLIDSPSSGYPDEGRGEFLISGSDGNPMEGGNLFSTLAPIPTTANPPCPVNNAVLVLEGAPPYQTGGKLITGFNPPTTLSVNTAFPATADTGFTVPYTIGCVPHAGNVAPSAILNANGVGSFEMRYPVNQLGRNFILTAEANGGQAGAVMRHWYLGQSQNVTLTADPSQIVLTNFEVIDGVVYTSGSRTIRLFLTDGGGEPLPAELVDVKVVISNPAVDDFADAQEAYDSALANCIAGGMNTNDCNQMDPGVMAAKTTLDRILAQLADPPSVVVSPEVIRTGPNGVVDVEIEASRFPLGSSATLSFATVGPTPNEANPILSNTATVIISAGNPSAEN